MKGDYVHFSFLIFWFVHISLLKKWVWLHIWNKIAFWFYLWNLKRKKKRKEGNHLWLSYWFEFSNICLILKAFSLHLTCKFFSQICKSPQKFHVKLNSMVYSGTYIRPWSILFLNWFSMLSVICIWLYTIKVRWHFAATCTVKLLSGISILIYKDRMKIDYPSKAP